MVAPKILVGTAEHELPAASCPDDPFSSSPALLRLLLHDLRTPLSSILLHAQLLQRSMNPSTPEARRTTSILANGQRMAAMLRDVQDVLQFGSGQGRLQLQPLNLGAWMQSLQPRLAQAFEGGLFTVAVGTDLPEVMADPARLERALVHLLAHVLQSAEPGARALLQVQVEPGEAVLSISADAGSFSPDETLGLYLARALVAAHGGIVFHAVRGGGVGLRLPTARVFA
ncbi:MAG: HAMP domain-containing histidine kinase [Deltaproteobacteria bacterium]|nr:HAMP domain-containing histidine kinase [Deltaproteobacteria bacterium]